MKMKGSSHSAASAECVTMRLFHKTTGGWLVWTSRWHLS